MKTIYTLILFCLCLHVRSNAHSAEWTRTKIADIPELILKIKNQIATRLAAIKKKYFGLDIPSEIKLTLEEKPVTQISSNPKNQTRTFEFKKTHYYRAYSKMRPVRNFYDEKQLKTLKSMPQSIFTGRNKLTRPSFIEYKPQSSHQNSPEEKQKTIQSEPSAPIDIDFTALSVDQLNKQITIHEAEYRSKAHGTQLKGASLGDGATFPHDIIFQTSKSFRFIDKETGRYQTQLYKTRTMLESKNPELEKIGRQLDEMTTVLRKKTYLKR